jgi:hypothetical protein
MFGRVLVAETRKLSRSAVWIPVVAAPLLVLLGDLFQVRSGVSKGASVSWLALYLDAIPVYSLLFLPLSICLVAALACRMEHVAGGWKQLHALPVPRYLVYTAKLIIVLALLALMQCLVGLGVCIEGWMLHAAGPIPWALVSKSLLGGWLASVPLAGLQLWAAVAWESFGLQFAVSTILTIPGLFVANSPVYGPWYPWIQPFLAMRLTHDQALSISPQMEITMVVSALVALVGGLWYFVRRDVVR